MISFPPAPSFSAMPSPAVFVPGPTTAQIIDEIFSKVIDIQKFEVGQVDPEGAIAKLISEKFPFPTLDLEEVLRKRCIRHLNETYGVVHFIEGSISAYKFRNKDEHRKKSFEVVERLFKRVFNKTPDAVTFGKELLKDLEAHYLEKKMRYFSSIKPSMTGSMAEKVIGALVKADAIFCDSAFTLEQQDSIARESEIKLPGNRMGQKVDEGLRETILTFAADYLDKHPSISKPQDLITVIAEAFKLAPEGALLNDIFDVWTAEKRNAAAMASRFKEKKPVRGEAAVAPF